MSCLPSLFAQETGPKWWVGKITLVNFHQQNLAKKHPMLTCAYFSQEWVAKVAKETPTIDSPQMTGT